MVRRALLDDRRCSMTPRAYAWCIVAGFLFTLLLSGCAGYDEHKCGGRLLDYRNGMCVGYGGGFSHQSLHPDVAREIERGRP